MKVVVDRLVQYPNRFQLVNVSTSEVLGVFDLHAVTGTIQQVGTEIDAELFQSIQDDLTQLAQDIVAESNARGVDVEALQNSIATKITANGGELGNGVVTFTEVYNAPNIASAESASTLFGKIKNWFSRLKALAFKDTIVDADVSTSANISQSKVSGLIAIQNKLNGIDAGANKYVLPVSTATNLGGVKVGSRLSVANDGTLSADSQTENSYTTTEKNKLSGIESGAQKNVVTSVAGKTGAVTLDKNNVGLGNVENVKQYSASNPPPYPVTSVNGQTGAVSISVPIVNNGTLTIQKNGTNVATFTANQSRSTTANIIVPTKTSELTNDSGLLTSVPTAGADTLGGVKVGETLSISDEVLDNADDIKIVDGCVYKLYKEHDMSGTTYTLSQFFNRYSIPTDYRRDFVMDVKVKVGVDVNPYLVALVPVGGTTLNQLYLRTATPTAANITSTAVNNAFVRFVNMFLSEYRSTDCIRFLQEQDTTGAYIDGYYVSARGNLSLALPYNASLTPNVLLYAYGTFTSTQIGFARSYFQTPSDSTYVAGDVTIRFFKRIK